MSGDSNGDQPQVIRPPNTLRKKAESAPKLDLKALEEADKVVQNLAGDYLKWVSDDIRALQEHVDGLEQGTLEEKPALDEIFRIAHDIKGQGGSFGYDLMTVIGNHLCRFIENTESATPAHLDVIKVHIDAMRLVVSQKIEGDGGGVGNKLVRGIEAVVAKVQGPPRQEGDG